MRISRTVALAVAAFTLTGCATSPPPDTVSEIPVGWLQKTAEGWPNSDAFGGDIPVMDSSPCVLGDVLPEILDQQPVFDSSGWGSYGEDVKAEDVYRYICDLGVAGRYAGSLQVIQAPNIQTARETVDLFTSQTDTSDQENTVTTVDAGQLEMHVLQRWIPSNPQGAYQAMYLDEDRSALVILEVNSLNEDDFAAYSDKAVANDLLAALAAGS